MLWLTSWAILSLAETGSSGWSVWRRLNRWDGQCLSVSLAISNACLLPTADTSHRAAAAAAVFLQLSFDKNGQISIVSSGLVKDIAHIAHVSSLFCRCLHSKRPRELLLWPAWHLGHRSTGIAFRVLIVCVRCRCAQCQSSSLKLAVAKICRLLALNNYGNELAQVGLIPVMVQLMHSGPGTESGEIGARVLCNMAQDPLCRKIIARAGVKLVRQSSNAGPEVVRTTCKKTANKIANSEHYPPHEWQVNLKSRYIQGDNNDVLD